jgi:hypothetical protein
MLTPDRIKPFLLHDDPDVRAFVVDYFAQSWSDDPELLPMVLDACERFGFEEDGRSLFYAARFTVTEPTLDRLLDLLARAEDEETIRRLNGIVVGAPGALLRARGEAIDRCSNILPEIRPRLGARREYLDWSGERLWAELQNFARRSQDDYITSDVNLDYAEDLVDALGDRDVPDAATICRLIAELEPEEGWLEVFLVNLAGRRRLPEAVPALVGKFRLDADYLLDRASEVLERIGDVEAVRLIRREYPGAEFGYRISATGILGHIKHPESEAAALELLECEDDGALRTWLCMALCDLFSDRALDTVRREMASGLPETTRELCAPALVVIKVLGLDPPPEAEAWEQQRRRQKEATNRALAELEDDDWPAWDDVEDDLFDEPEVDESRLAVTAPIRNIAPRVGRNDPCPCGSGLLFKKCCLTTGCFRRGGPGPLRAIAERRTSHRRESPCRR